ncbi:hypothetical protein ILUMI_18051 [Ignelater luminosus]|uniref:VWFC domain-containing protein n=1 Tax=Ignelater luminosus TaxID=2038154 RepID=A0A8K0CMW1_IGNLU|nr:hypothetical protein ILUMI_18051 [Ignelater luminosus]
MFTLSLFGFATLFMLSNAQHNNCNSNLNSNFVYEDLKCAPNYDDSKTCIKEYDCSHINNKPSGNCLLRGKLYNPGETPDAASGASGRCDHAKCTCSENGDFRCRVPSDTCGEWWGPSLLKPGCYFGYELNKCCSSSEICPPFDGNVKCEVNGVTYKEGERFNHPTEKCTQCVCHKGFNGNLVAPFCQKMNCTTELLYSEQIRDHCAPFFRDADSCCPSRWICPAEDQIYVPASSQPPKEPQCQFGNRKMHIGDKIRHKDSWTVTTCECVTPPYLTCTSKVEQA